MMNFERKKQYLVSIIIPVYNIEPIKRAFFKCIKSILNQTYKNIEVIIINDGSTDNTTQIIGKMALREEKIKVITKENGGVESSRRLGIKTSSGDFILHVDQDDILDKHAIEKMLRTAITSNADIVIGEFIQFFLFKGIRRKNVKQFNDSAITISNEQFICNYYEGLFGYTGIPIQIWNKLYKKSFLNGISEPECCYEYCEDLIYNIQVMPQAKIISYIPQITYYYRWGGITSKRIENIIDVGIIVYNTRKTMMSMYKLDRCQEAVCIDLLNYLYSSVYQAVLIDRIERNTALRFINSAFQTVEINEAINSLDSKKEYAEQIKIILAENPTSLYEYVYQCVEHDRLKNSIKKIISKIAL